jgi:dTMP kinase
MSGILVCLEGIDASGKTTTSSALVDYLYSRGVSVIQLEKKGIEYPTNYLSTFMSKFKELLWESKKEDPVTEIPDAGWLYMHALWYKIMDSNLIQPALSNYEVVVVDSWYHKISTRFMLKDNFDYELVRKVFEDLPKGDLVFMLDVAPEICWGRRENFKPSEIGGHEFLVGSEYDRFIRYQSKVREYMLKLATKEEKWRIVDANSISFEEKVAIIAEETKKITRNRL